MTRLHRLACAFVLVGSLLPVSLPAATLPAYRNAVIADGAVAYYEFETGTPIDSVTTDVGGANDGIIQVPGSVGTIALSFSSALGNAYDFSGGNVRITDNVIFDVGTGAYSVEMWFNSDGTTRGDLFNYKGTGGDFGIFKNSDATNVAQYHDAVIGSAAGIPNGVWHHLVITRAATGGAVNFYIDGASVATGTDNGTLNIAADVLIGSNFGANNTIPAIQFDGRIDEVAWYTTTLSPAQVATHYALAAPVAVPEPTMALGMIPLAILCYLCGHRNARISVLFGL